MPSTPEAIEVYRHAGILYGPAKAANAGGVATSALEMTQNAQFANGPGRKWNSSALDRIMTNIHAQCRQAAATYGHEGDLFAGANIAGF